MVDGMPLTANQLLKGTPRHHKGGSAPFLPPDNLRGCIFGEFKNP